MENRKHLASKYYPNFELEIEALEDLKAKGEVTEEEFNKRYRKLKKDQNLFFARSKAFTAPKMSKRVKLALSELREKMLTEKSREFLEKKESE